MPGRIWRPPRRIPKSEGRKKQKVMPRMGRKTKKSPSPKPSSKIAKKTTQKTIEARARIFANFINRLIRLKYSPLYFPSERKTALSFIRTHKEMVIAALSGELTKENSYGVVGTDVIPAITAVLKNLKLRYNEQSRKIEEQNGSEFI